MASVVQAALGPMISNLAVNASLALPVATPAGRAIVCIVPTWGDYSAQPWVLEVSGEPTAGNAHRMVEVGAPTYNAARLHGWRAFVYPAVVNAGVKTVTLLAAGATGMYGSLNLLEVTDHNPAGFFVREAVLPNGVRANSSLAIDAAIGDLVVGAIEGTTSQAAGAGYTAWDFVNTELFDHAQYRTATAPGAQAVNWTHASGTTIAKAWVFGNNAPAGTAHSLEGAAAGSSTPTGAATVTKPLAGGAAGSAAASAGAAVGKPLAGAAAGSATPSASLAAESDEFFVLPMLNADEESSPGVVTNISYAWWPSLAAALSQAPAVSGSGAALDAQGQLIVARPPGLAAGQVHGYGFVTNINADGSFAAGERAYIGPWPAA